EERELFGDCRSMASGAGQLPATRPNLYNRGLLLPIPTIQNSVIDPKRSIQNSASLETRRLPLLKGGFLRAVRRSSDRIHWMRIFLTGGTGYIGRALARRLAEAGHE